MNLRSLFISGAFQKRIDLGLVKCKDMSGDVFVRSERESFTGRSPVTVGDQAAIPKGSSVTGTVTLGSKISQSGQTFLAGIAGVENQTAVPPPPPSKAEAEL